MEIWDYDFRDDFIWLPEESVDGLVIFVADGEPCTYTSEIEGYQYVAEKTVFQYIADRSD